MVSTITLRRPSSPSPVSQPMMRLLLLHLLLHLQSSPVDSYPLLPHALLQRDPFPDDNGHNPGYYYYWENGKIKYVRAPAPTIYTSTDNTSPPPSSSPSIQPESFSTWLQRKQQLSLSRDEAVCVLLLGFVVCVIMVGVAWCLWMRRRRRRMRRMGGLMRLGRRLSYGWGEKVKAEDMEDGDERGRGWGHEG